LHQLCQVHFDVDLDIGIIYIFNLLTDWYSKNGVSIGQEHRWLISTTRAGVGSFYSFY